MTHLRDVAREVVFTNGAGEVLAHVKATDDGFFWSPLLDGGDASPLANGRAAVRAEGGEERVMKTPASGSCAAGASCHGGSAGPIVAR